MDTNVAISQSPKMYTEPYLLSSFEVYKFIKNSMSFQK